MRYVELIPGVRSSAVGFGCASLLGATASTASRRAIDLAIGLGVTHFDLAPSYGYGAAEAFVGRHTQGRRDGLVLVTKFGIEARAGARILAPLKPMVRAFRRSCAGRRCNGGAVMPNMGRFFNRRVEFTPANMRRSLEKSLSRLRTDRVDLLLLHEPQAEVEQVEALAAMAGLLKGEGKILAWGLSAQYEELSRFPRVASMAEIVQFGCPATPPALSDARDRYGDRPNVIFSPFRAARSSPLLSYKVPDSNPLAGLQNLFPRSVILCSMLSEGHIRSNCLAAQSTP